MFQDITIEEMLELQAEKGIVLIDVRSPQEFADSTIPGSINIPLFDNEERKEIGTLYKQYSVQAAKDKGLEVVSAKLPAFIKQFEQITEQRRAAVYCWRGGMRSKTTATVLSLMGIRVYRLAGGIRSYRKWVLESLETFRFHPRCIVINGYTGTGKTTILHQLARKGYPILDLEQLAQHRGSIFGQIGLRPNNQKTFEALLLQQLLQINDQPFVFIEAESKRIGKAVMPDFLVQAKERGIQIFLEMPFAERVRHIIEEYKPHQYKQQCIEAFHQIKKNMHTPIAAQIENDLQEDRFSEAVSLLLEHYYDPRYEHAISRYDGERMVIPADNVEHAVRKLLQHVDKVNGTVEQE